MAQIAGIAFLVVGAVGVWIDPGEIANLVVIGIANIWIAAYWLNDQRREGT